MTVTLLRGNALHLPLADNTVDLVVTSPPYFGLRAYSDNGVTYDGQLGSEATPAEYVDALIAATREMMRVLKPGGSIWVNLGDKYAGSTGGGPPSASSTLAGNGHVGGGPKQQAGAGRASGFRITGAPTKSLIGVPWRYALRCIDDLGLILRAEIVLDKKNGLPESVTDRVRRSHEQVFHFVQQPRYYSAVDEIREEHKPGQSPTALSFAREGRGTAPGQSVAPHRVGREAQGLNPFGKLPGSVWEYVSQPFTAPPSLGIDHFAAFNMALPRRIIRGWSPAGICVACGEGRRPAVSSVSLNMERPQARRAQELAERAGLTEDHFDALLSVGVSDTGRGKATQSGTGKNRAEVYRLAAEARAVLGGYAREYLLRRPSGLSYACSCPDTTAPTRPSVVLDPFSGTGTTCLVADVLGRHGIGLDMSGDYTRLARWRTTDPAERAKAMQVDKPPVEVDGQGDLFGGWVA